MTRAAAACQAPQEAVPAAPLATGGTALDCPMCGLAFTTGATVCAGCPLHGGCDLVRCPRCAYTFPRTSRLVELLRRLIRRVRATGAARSDT